METIKVGVMGCGEMGQHHVRVYSQLEGVGLIGIADLDRERVSKLAKEYETEAFTDYNELLKLDLDVVTIAVPTTLHKEVALNTMNRGINLLVEKPIADTLENADAIIKGAEKNDTKLMVGHIERFNPAVIALKENQNEIGRIVAISAKRVGPYNPRIRDVGIITDLGVHDIDVMSYLYSERIKNVHAYAGSVIHKFEDYAHILLGFNNGNSGAIETNWLTPHKIRQLTVTGTKGIAQVDYIEQSLRIYNGEGEIDVEVEKREPLRNELEHFIECIQKDKRPIIGGWEGKHALETALAAVRSYKEERVIEVLP